MFLPAPLASYTRKAFPWRLTRHARERGAERFGLDGASLEALLNRSLPIRRDMRACLVQSSNSEAHRSSLGPNSPFSYRVADKAIFVLRNLEVVTVFGFPQAYVELVRKRRRASKAWGKQRDRKAAAVAASQALARAESGSPKPAAGAPSLLAS